MARRFIYFWDPTPGGNVDHVTDSGVSQDEFEQVLEVGFRDRVRSRSSWNRWIVYDYTRALRKLVIVFELDDLSEEDAWGITPVTAYPPEKLPTKG